MKSLQNKHIVFIILLVLCMLGIAMDQLPLSIMEARNFISAREMLQDGNWLLTTMNGDARYEKPPLPTWLTAVSGNLFGIHSLFALRLPAVLCMALIGVMTYLLSKKIVANAEHSFINALIVITSFYVIGITFEGPWDIYAHGFMLVAIYHLFKLFQQKKQRFANAIIPGLFIGCSILSKGPVSLYALLLPFLISYGMVYRFRDFRLKWFPIILTIVLAMGIGASWYLYVKFHDPQTLADIAERETGNWTSYNVRPFYYYWSFFVQSGLWTIPALISLMYPYLKSRVRNLKAYRFTLLWTVIGVILLSIIPEKKSRYLMPILIPLALNTGFYIDYLIRKFKSMQTHKETFPVYFNFGLMALIGLALPIVLYIVLGDSWQQYLWRFGLASVVGMVIGILIVIQLKQKAMKNVFYLTVLFFMSLLITVVPLLNVSKSPYYNPIPKTETNNIPIYSLSYISPEMIWFSGDKIPSIKQNNQYTFPNKKRFGLLTTDVDAEDWIILQKEFTMEKVETFDLNWVYPKSGRYNDRLVNDFYILTRKP